MLLHGFADRPAGPLHVAIGVFDGVHLGHQELVRRLTEGTRREGATALATTFDPLPIEVLAPGAPVAALSTLDERAELLRKAGADAVAVFHFDVPFSKMPAREFVDRVLGGGEVTRIVVGPDFRFGHGREGDVALLAEMCSARATRLEVVAPVERDGAIVSSTRIRGLLQAGDVRGATALLGRQYSIVGAWRAAGRLVGRPTIDLEPPRKVLPREGAYATWVSIADRRWPAVTTVSARSARGAGEPSIRSLVDGAQGALEDAPAKVAFVERLRDDLRSASEDEREAQLAIDLASAQQVLGVHPGGA